MSRPRDDGIVIGTLESGPRNSIADVGVTVGHVTVEQTGVSAVVPPSLPLPAGTAVLNGAGELTGSLEIREWGLLETPVYLTSTHGVGRVYDGAVSVAMAADSRVGVDDVVIPVVGECDDSWLSDARVDRESTRLNSSHMSISYAVFCLKKKNHRMPSRGPPH